MSVLPTTHPTLLDIAKMMDPNGAPATIIEILNQTNEILDDMVWQEGNLVTGNRVTARLGLPSPTWRKFNQGVLPNKGRTIQFTDSCGMMEAYAEADKALVDLAGNKEAWRMNDARAHIEGMSQEFATTLFYGNEATAPEKFTGLAPRYNLTTANNGENIIVGGGSQTDNGSIWLIGWGPNTVHGIYPKGSKAGIQYEDKGQVTIQSMAGVAGAHMEAYQSHFRWDCGITVMDWRYIVRIPNIDKSSLTYSGATGADLVTLMTRAVELLPSLSNVRPVFYVSRSMKTFLRTQITAAVKNSTLTMDTVAGRSIMSFDGIPVKRVDALAADEALVS